MPTELPDPDNLLLTYIHGEPVIGVFDKTLDSPLTKEHLNTSDLSPLLDIIRVMPWRDSTHFLFSQSRWICAKINPAIEMAQRQYAEEGS